MRRIVVMALLFIYKNYKRSNVLRNLIKRLVGNNKIEIAFNNFKIYAGVNNALESNVIFDSYNEIMVLELIKMYSLKGYDFIDIGANVGLHSLTAATSNTIIDVYSFEPEPNNYQDFIKNIILNQCYNIRPFKMGLGNLAINKTLNINEGWNKGKHSLKLNFEGSYKKINIPLTTLDTFKENIKSNNLIVKIDVEGYEKEVIEGAKYVFFATENIILIIELLEENNGFVICREIADILRANNFEYIYKITNNSKLTKVSDFDGSADYVFIKGKHAKENFDDYLL